MKTIPLTQGKVALIDDEDFELVSKFSWYLLKHKKLLYAHCVMYMGRANKKDQYCYMYMHRLIMRPSIGMDIDHRDHNGLNCQRFNMRICTTRQNSQNALSHDRSSSRFKGVSWACWARKWRSQIRVNGKRIHNGYFFSEVDAARAYDRAALKYFGEFACTNFLKENYAC